MAIRYYSDNSPYRLRGKRKIAQWIARCIAELGFRAGDINYIFCSAESHIAINRTYLGHDYHTDVITFDYTADGVISGDIFIDPLTVRMNAATYGATAREEMLRVMIHGVLHLCGYGDKTPEEQVAMRSREDLCLSKLSD